MERSKFLAKGVGARELLEQLQSPAGEFVRGQRLTFGGLRRLTTFVIRFERRPMRTFLKIFLPALICSFRSRTCRH